MPHRDTIIIPEFNSVTVDPIVGSDTAPISASRLRLDRAIPLVAF